MSDAYIVRRGKIIQGGGGFDPNGAVLKVVTSTGCSVAVTGTGYSRTHQDSDGFPRSDDANVTEHFFSIPASAFGNFSVTATNNYGSNFKTVEDINTAGRVYEVKVSAPNIILNSTFGLQDGVTLNNAHWQYSDFDKTITHKNSGSVDYGTYLFAGETSALSVSPYSRLTITAQGVDATTHSMSLVDEENHTLWISTALYLNAPTEVTNNFAFDPYYDTAGLICSCSNISEIVFDKPI